MDYADQSERYARPFKLEQTTVDGLTTTMQTTVSQKVGQAMRTIADGLAWTICRLLRADRLAWTMPSRAEGLPGHANYSRQFG